MSRKHLGETFDIHGGGIDLVFPHHENEIAQSRCAFHTQVMANVWMHNGFLQVEGEKMSKSLGNFITIREVLNDWPGDVARARDAVDAISPADQLDGEGICRRPRRRCRASSMRRRPRPSRVRRRRVLEALADDLNTPKAIAEMHALKNPAGRKALAGTLAFFGFREDELKAWQQSHAPAPALAAERDRKPHRRAQRRACREELGRVRSHPRRTRRPWASC